MLPTLPWNRYWYPREDSITYTTEGFLPDPNDRWEKNLNPNLKNIDQFDELPCVVLLGEAGTGKTDVLQREEERLRDTPHKNRTVVIYSNLGNAGSEASLFRNLLDSPQITEWLKGEHDLYLLLDAFDEALLDLSALGGLLAEEIKKWPKNRLKLRLACRPAVWQTVLEANFIKAFENNHVQVFNLAPLTRADVLLAAQSMLQQPNNFLDEVVKKSVAAFAIKPVTLQMLLASFQEKGALPETQAEIYREGCFWLCKELNPSRVDKQKTGRVPPEERILIAQYIAAASVYCRKNAIRVKAQNPLEHPPEILDLDSLRLHHRIEVDDGKLRETLDTSLFSSSGLGFVSWAHRTYAEFLAAEWCRVNTVSVGKMFELLSVEEEQNRRVPLQLIQAAAWLAEIVPGIRDLILANDPRVLLYCDPAVLDIRIRELLTQAFLDRYESRQEVESYYRSFKNLCHPKLADQLRPYISNKTKLLAVREIALQIGTFCRVKGLDAELSLLVQDSSQERQLRITALAALSEVGSERTKFNLRQFVLTDDPTDIDDEIKGWALRSVWPNHLSPAELFASLTFIKKSHFHGSYSSFLYSLADKLESEITPDALLIALEWANKYRSQDIDTNPLGYVSDAIVKMAWNHSSNPDICRGLALFVSRRIGEYGKMLLNETILGERNGPSFDELLASDDEKRRRLALNLIPLLAATRMANYLSAHYQIVTGKDAVWLIQQKGEHTGAERELILDWLRRLPDEPRKGSAILEGLKNGALDSSFRDFVYVELDSPAAREIRKYAHRSRPKKPLSPTAEERVRDSLERAENGHLASWIQLTHDLKLGPDSSSSPHEHGDLQQLPGWQNANADTRMRILSAAAAYVHRAELLAFDFVGTKNCPYWAMAEYKALLLLSSVMPETLNNKDSGIFKRWSIVALWYPVSAARELQKKLISHLFKSNPTIFLDSLSFELEKNGKDKDCYAVTTNLEYCWGPETENLILAHIKRWGLASACPRGLLKRMLELKSDKAQSIASEELLFLLNQNETEQRNFAVELSAMLLRHSAVKTWPLIWPLFQANTSFGQQVIEQLAFFEVPFIRELPDSALADLFVWLETNYPHKDDVESSGFVGSREMVPHFRDNVLRQLYRRGAVQEIERIMKNFPGLDWLHWSKNQAKDARAESLWIPPNPEALLALAAPVPIQVSSLSPNKNDFLIGFICNVLATLLFWFIPSDVTKLAKMGFAGTALVATLYILYFRLLRAGKRSLFWAATILTLLLATAELTYMFEEWWLQ